MTHGALAQLRQLAGLVASAPSLAIYHLAEEARVAGHIDDECWTRSSPDSGTEQVNELDPPSQCRTNRRPGLVRMIE